MIGLACGGDDALLKAKQAKKEADQADEKKDPPGASAETAVDGVKKEEVKKEEDLKDELKDELLEVKTEVKEELDDSEDALNDIMEAETTAVGKGKKRKRFDYEGPVPPMPAVDSDTEYEKVSIKDFPGSLRVEAASMDRINGLYKKFPKPSRGRPAYVKVSRLDAAKNMYLFWHDGKWHIAPEFGEGQKSFASIIAAAGIQPPFEPFPGIWKVLEKHKEKDDGKKSDTDKDKVECLLMRVVDDTFWDQSHDFQDMDQPYEAHARGQLEAHIAKTEKSEKRKEEREEAKAEVKDKTSAARSQQTPPQARKQPAPPEKSSSSTKGQKNQKKSPKAKALPVVKTGDDEADMVAAAAAAAGDEDSDDDPKAKPQSAAASAPSDSESASESDSEESSSSGSSEASEQEKDEDDLKDMNDTAKTLVGKLKAMNKAEAIEKAQKLFKSLRTRVAKGMGNHPELDTRNVDLLREWCKRNLNVTLPPIDPYQPRQGQGPAPDRAQPKTPPMDKDAGTVRDPNAQMPHKIQMQIKSVLRRSGLGVQNKRNMSFQASSERDKPVETMEHAIDSWKRAGSDLWYPQPGSQVACSGCDKPFPQQLGMLQGWPERSQFAQMMFFCQECGNDPVIVERAKAALMS